MMLSLRVLFAVFLLLGVWLASCSAVAAPAAVRASTDPRATTGELVADQRFSFDGPFSGKQIPYWEMLGHAILPSDAVRLTTLSPSRAGVVRGSLPVPFSSWQLDFDFRVTGGRLGADGLAVWYAREPLVVGEVYGAGPKRFAGVAVAFDTFDNDGSGDHPLISLLKNDGYSSYEATSDGANLAVAACSGVSYRNTRFAVQASLRYASGLLQLFVRAKPDGDWQQCFGASVSLPTGYYLGFSASTGEVSDKHDIISAYVYNLAPGAEDPAVLQQLYGAAAKSAPADFEDDAGAPAHHHIEQRPVAAPDGSEDDAGAPPHKHTNSETGSNPFAAAAASQQQREHEHEHVEIQTRPLVPQVPFNSEQPDIASKNLAETIKDEDMVYFKWKKRFEKTRESLREIGAHDDDTDTDHPWELPDTATQEPLFDESSAPEDVFELYDILAEDVWVIKTMQYDTMKLIDQLQDVIRHQGEHNDEQHRVFADSFEKLLREVATRHTIQDALKEQLLRFELQKHDLHTMNKEFVGHMESLKGEFDSVSHTVRAKVGAQQEILATQVKDLQKDFRDLAASLSSLTQQLQRLSAAQPFAPPDRPQPYDEPSDSSWFVYAAVLVAVAVVVAVVAYLVNRGRNKHRTKVFHAY